MWTVTCFRGTSYRTLTARKAIRSEQTTISDESKTLNDVFPTEKNHHLFMHFDFGDDWVFKIIRSRKKANFVEGVDYPRVIENIGKNPEQYPMFEECE